MQSVNYRKIQTANCLGWLLWSTACWLTISLTLSLGSKNLFCTRTFDIYRSVKTYSTQSGLHAYFVVTFAIYNLNSETAPSRWPVPHQLNPLEVCENWLRSVLWSFMWVSFLDIEICNANSAGPQTQCRERYVHGRCNVFIAISN
jgi:hypothetical protein